MAEQLVGKYNHNIDAKGRLIIPAKLRDALGSRFILFRGPEKCIYGYSKEEWNRIGSELMELDSTDEEIRQLQRAFNFSGTEVEVDTQGRIVVSAELRDYAGITKEVVIGGNGNKIEIWDKAEFDKANSPEINVADLLSHLGSKGVKLRF
ncbi:MAG: division/cell wall cluster transcriptional repressor MraZ [Lachnospiraceae bacterium]|nr:division/cell wall cluster transcriptional repressor MraZ [Lachnospiraceae bacterium]